ncbi:MAG: hypothetical protein GY751_14675, partial [Bacteroidetes bacterium]|nr:hypothetical protein [Bacteroidota bacterium]
MNHIHPKTDTKPFMAYPYVFAILSIFFFLPFYSFSQVCELEEPIIIPANSEFDFIFDYDGAANDDLSNTSPPQSICRIEIKLLHESIERLSLSLTSPAGQTVQLIGPGMNNANTTFFASWDIQFINDNYGYLPEPDSSFLDFWDNDQNWINGGQYSGSYYPYSGFLGDFNTGPVNGQWTLHIDNNPSAVYDGAIFDFRIILCDDSGISCCFADGGEVTGFPDTLLCQGDNSLALTLSPEFDGEVPDTTDYGYTYVISTDGIITTYDSIPDLTGYPAGDYEICGLSYKRIDYDSFPAPNGILTTENLRNNLNGLDPSFCAKISDSCINITISTPPDTTDLFQTICDGDTTWVGSQFFTESGIYTEDLISHAGCDSIVTLNLTVLPLDTIYLQQTICEGDSFSYLDSTYYLTGNYWHTLTTTQNCDSLVVLELEVLEPVDTSFSTSICSGDSYSVGDSTFTNSGNYTIHLLSSQNCDSTVYLSLSVLDIVADIQVTDTITCTITEVLLDGSNSSLGPEITYFWTSPDAILSPSDSSRAYALSSGNYILQVTFTENSLICTAQDTVFVEDELTFPISDAGTDMEINCYTPTLQIGGVSTSMGENFSYEWTTTDGHFIGTLSESTVSIDSAGTYFLSVLDTMIECETLFTVLISQIFTPPIADAGIPSTLNCETVLTSIGGTATSIGTEFIYVWSGPCIVAGGNNRIADVNCAGTYILQLTNTENGCESQDSIVIQSDTISPNVQAEVIGVLSCKDSIVTLNGTNSDSGSDYSALWTGPGITGNESDLTINVSVAGMYYLEIENTVNGCSSMDSFEVLIDTIPPDSDAGLGGIITCDHPMFMLGGSGSSTGDEISYQWYPASFPNSDELHPEISTPGTYTLVVTDTITGCTDTSSAVILPNFYAPLADGGSDMEINCAISQVILGSLNTETGPNYYPTWYSLNGHILSTPDSTIIVADEPGTYILSNINTQNGCFQQDTVLVTIDPFYPVANVIDTSYLSCETGLATLNGSGSSFGTNFSYQWKTQSGQIISGEETLFPEVSFPGIYTLVVTDEINNCADSMDVLVILDCIPFVAIASPDTVTCENTGNPDNPVVLDGSASDSGSFIEYQWYTHDGTFQTSSDTTQPTVGVTASGNYTLVVTNTVLGIADSATVFVPDNLVEPFAQIGPADTLTCEITQIQLNGNASSTEPGFSYLWTTFDGNIIGDVTELNPFVNAPGYYVLNVISAENGCTSSDVIIVTQDQSVPVPNTGPVNQIPCLLDTVSLIGTVSPPNNAYQYEWTTTDGHIFSGANTLRPVVDSVGTYIFTVTDTENDCTASESIYVSKQSCAPCIDILPPDTLNCIRDTVLLSVNFCSPDSNIVYTWATSDGVFCAGAGDSLTVAVCSSGTYTFSATDTLAGFTSQENIVVAEDYTLPIAEGGADSYLTCTSQEVILDGSSSSSGTEYAYNWTSVTGNTITNAQSPQPTVHETGTYLLQVSNLQNGCVSWDSTLVEYDTISPIADAGPSMNLTCNVTSLNLDGSNSTFSSDIIYTWTSPDISAIILGAANTPEPLIGGEGWYFLEVKDTISGCFSTDSVWVTLADDPPPDVGAGIDRALTCGTPVLTLNAHGPGGIYSIQWRYLGNGSVVGNFYDLEVSMAGEYELIVRDTFTGCFAVDTAVVFEDFVSPSALVNPAPNLNCESNEIQLSGVGSSEGGGFINQWTVIEDGNILFGEETLTPTIDAAGTYQLLITDLANECQDSAEVIVGFDGMLPIANAGNDTSLTCSVQSIVLNGSLSSEGDTISYFWASPDGSIVQGETTTSPLIDQPGTYYLTVENTANGCSAQDEVVVTKDTNPPIASIEDTGLVITCESDSIQLDASASSPAGILEYAWTTQGGHFKSPTNSAFAIVDASGLYLLQVTNSVNNCTDTTSVWVGRDENIPNAALEIPDVLNCVRTTVLLESTPPASPGNYSYNWTTFNGNIIGDSTLSSVTVDLPGQYLLNVLNSDNGCMQNLSVNVDIDTTAPNISILLPPFELDCDHSSITLSGQSNELNATYHWQTSTGSILGSDDYQEVIINAPGVYFLEVTDTLTGCISIESISITSDAIPITGFNLTISPPTCTGNRDGSIVVDNISGGVPPYLYALNSDFYTSNSNFNYLPGDTYILIIQDVNGCESDTTITIDPPEEIQVELGEDITIQLGDSTELIAFVNKAYN